MIFHQNASFAPPPYPFYYPSLNDNVGFNNYFLLPYFPFAPSLHPSTVQAHKNANSANVQIQHKVKLQNTSINQPIHAQSKLSQHTTERQEQKIMYLQNRNVLPNNVSLILCFVRRVKKSGKMVQKIISKFDAPNNHFNSKRFYSYQIYLKENYTDFKWRQGIEVLVSHQDPKCTSFTLEEQRFYNKVCRILISMYLQRICLLQVLNHTKISKSYIEDHLKVIRYLKECVKSKLRSKITIKYQ